MLLEVIASSRPDSPADAPLLTKIGGLTMRMRRVIRAVSSFVTQLCVALVKAVVMCAVVGLVLVTIMHSMGVPVPNIHELLRGVSRLADVLS